MQPPSDVVIDCDIPSGNIIFETLSNDDVYLHQDLRDTEGYWFYWHFRVRGVADRTLTFHFTQGTPVGVHGPAASTDGGKTWAWLGSDSATEASFHYTFPPEASDTHFCVTIPYLETNLRDFLRKYKTNPSLQVDKLCETRQGRSVEKLYLGRLDGNCAHRVLLTCRHHACESMASYSLEGVMEAVLADTVMGRSFRDHVEFLVIPFMDKDGAENGDQGKNRKPYDHNRDYGGQSIYPSVRALRQLVPQWSEGRLRFALDMHCPGLRGPRHEVIHFVGGPDVVQWNRVAFLSGLLEEEQRGPLIFSAKDNLPFGQDWNVPSRLEDPFGALKSCARWTADLPGVQLGTSIEIPYANADGKTVTAETAKAFGHDLARAIYRFLEAPVE